MIILDDHFRSEEHHDFYQAHGIQGMKIKPTSVVIAEAPAEET